VSASAIPDAVFASVSSRCVKLVLNDLLSMFFLCVFSVIVSVNK
jgi:hypothetical protein